MRAKKEKNTEKPSRWNERRKHKNNKREATTITTYGIAHSHKGGPSQQFSNQANKGTHSINQQFITWHINVIFSIYFWFSVEAKSCVRLRFQQYNPQQRSSTPYRLRSLANISLGFPFGLTHCKHSTRQTLTVDRCERTFNKFFLVIYVAEYFKKNFFKQLLL